MQIYMERVRIIRWRVQALSSFVRPLKIVIDYIEETQSEWSAGNGIDDKNGSKYILLPKKPQNVAEELCRVPHAAPDKVAWHVAVVETPAYPEYAFLVYKFQRRLVRK